MLLRWEHSKRELPDDPEAFSPMHPRYFLGCFCSRAIFWLSRRHAAWYRKERRAWIGLSDGVVLLACCLDIRYFDENGGVGTSVSVLYYAPIVCQSSISMRAGRFRHCMPHVPRVKRGGTFRLGLAGYKSPLTRSKWSSFRQRSGPFIRLAADLRSQMVA